MAESGIAQLVLASRNRKKVAELAALLQPLGIELLSVADVVDGPEPEETGLTFAENACIKADAALAATGLPSIADDSGLAVDILDGQPGVRSARYAGDNATDAENNRLLLERLAHVPAEKRTARFISVIALARPGRETVVFSGETTGRILTAEQGEGGFGYDPLFLSDDLNQTFAQASPDDKNRVSHRGRALAKCIGYIRENPL